jgi:hypothetical protein
MLWLLICQINTRVIINHLVRLIAMSLKKQRVASIGFGEPRFDEGSSDVGLLGIIFGAINKIKNGLVWLRMVRFDSGLFHFFCHLSPSKKKRRTRANL